MTIDGVKGEGGGIEEAVEGGEEGAGDSRGYGADGVGGQLHPVDGDAE